MSPDLNQRINSPAQRFARDRILATKPAAKVPSGNGSFVERSQAAQKAAARKAASLERRDLKSADSIITDTIPVADSGNIVENKLKSIESFDSLYMSLSLEDRLRIIGEATNTVSANQYMVVTTTQRMDYEVRRLRKHEIEWHRKFSLSIACLIFLFIGAPLGAIIRKGGLGLPTVISTLLFILYYIISLIGQKVVEEGLMTSFQGMWLSSFVLVVAGVFLTYQATNDSAILNLDTYLNWIREKAGLRKGILIEKKMHIIGKFELIDVPRTELQSGFKTILEMAEECSKQLKKDAGWNNLAKRSFDNTGYFYLIEFGIHYNSFIDQVILSKWYRIPYFEKRLTEFPWINGKITSTIFTNKYVRWIAAIIFPAGLGRLIHLKIKVHRLQQNLNHLVDLSAGMINLLNSSALRIDADII